MEVWCASGCSDDSERGFPAVIDVGLVWWRLIILFILQGCVT
jgi:hypothetical protein